VIAAGQGTHQPDRSWSAAQVSAVAARCDGGGVPHANHTHHAPLSGDAAHHADVAGAGHVGGGSAASAAPDAGAASNSEFSLAVWDDTTASWPRRPSEVGEDAPSVARVYNTYLGGMANFDSDRDFARRVAAVIPEVKTLAHAHCRALARGVLVGMEHGARQIVDIGAGIATVWSTHHIARAHDPTCRVLYVDNELVAVESIRAGIANDDRLGVLRADVREPDAILRSWEASQVIDFARPVILVMGLLWHFVPDSDDPAGLLARYRTALAPGSVLVLTHDTAQGREQDMALLAQLYAQTNRPLVLRGREEIADLLRGWDILDPGIVYMPLWRPNTDDPDLGLAAERSCVYMAVART